jgi:hypothetical protein
MADFSQTNTDLLGRDLVFLNGDLRIAREEEEVSNLNVNRLKFFRGEYFLDREDGIPYFELLFQKGLSFRELYFYLYREIEELNLPLGWEIQSFDLRIEQRSYKLSYILVKGSKIVEIGSRLGEI